MTFVPNPCTCGCDLEVPEDADSYECDYSNCTAPATHWCECQGMALCGNDHVPDDGPWNRIARWRDGWQLFLGVAP